MDFNKRATDNFKGDIKIIGSISNRKSYGEIVDLKFSITDYMNMREESLERSEING